MGCPHTGRFGAALAPCSHPYWRATGLAAGKPACGVALILGETEAQRGWEPPSRQPRALLEFGISVLTTGAFPHPLGPPKCHVP